MTDRPGTDAGQEAGGAATPAPAAVPGAGTASWPFAPGEASPAVQGERPANAEPDVRGAGATRHDAGTDATLQVFGADADAAGTDAGTGSGRGADRADGPQGADAADAGVDGAAVDVDPGAASTERLADYLDAGRQPWDPALEEHPGNRARLAAMERLRALTGRMLADDAETECATAPSWVAGVLDQVRQEARTGRDIPLAPPGERVQLTLTEGAVRGLVREAGDGVDGCVVLSCRLDGDVTVPGEPVVVSVVVSVLFGRSFDEVSDAVRTAVAAALAEQTEIVVARLDVSVRDVHELAHDEGSTR